MPEQSLLNSSTNPQVVDVQVRIEKQMTDIVVTSGVEQSQAQIVLDNFQGYFKIAAEWEQKAKNIIVTDAFQKDVMELARTGRLLLSKQRNEIEKKRKALKEEYLRKGKLIDNIAGVLKGLITPTEEYLEKQEKFVELELARRAEEKRLEAEAKAAEELAAQMEAEDQERAIAEENRLRELKEANERAQAAEAQNTALAEQMAEQQRINIANEAAAKLQLEHAQADKEQVQADKDAIEAQAAAELQASQEREAQLQIERDQAAADALAKEQALKKSQTAMKRNAAAFGKAKAAQDEALKAEREKREAAEAALKARQVTCPNCNHVFVPQGK